MSCKPLEINVLIARKRAGKDTYLENFKKNNPKVSDKVVNLKFATPIKESTSKIFGEPLEILESDEKKEKKYKLNKEEFIKNNIKNVIELYSFLDFKEFQYEKFLKDVKDKVEEVASKYTTKEDNRYIEISPREYQQQYGSEICRHFDNQIFVKLLLNELSKEEKNGKIVYITDARFLTEINSIVEYVEKNDLEKNCKIKYIFSFEFDKSRKKLKTFNEEYDEHLSEKLSQELEKFILDIANSSENYNIEARKNEINWALKNKLIEITNKTVIDKMLSVVFNERIPKEIYKNNKIKL